MIAGSMPPYVFGSGAIQSLPRLLAKRRPGWVLWLVDHYFRGLREICLHGSNISDQRFCVDTTFEPTVESVDRIAEVVRDIGDAPTAIVAIGGGSTMDTAKAVSVLLTNPGKAADYQGWDLVKEPAVYKIGVPTISGTGSESSSTAVLTNHAKGLKLGINSPYSRFDQVVLDPDLTKTVPHEQRFYTAMDTWFHCNEYLYGHEHNRLTSELAESAAGLVSEVFVPYWLDPPADDDAREMLMVASYLGGAAAGCTGLVHPFSAGLSMVLGLRHGLANCVAVRGLQDLAPMYHWFMDYLEDSHIELPTGLCADLTDDQMEQLYQSTIVHEKPLRNALGDGWRDVLTREKVLEIFGRM